MPGLLGKNSPAPSLFVLGHVSCIAAAFEV
jgi:hypothetical protein